MERCIEILQVLSCVPSSRETQPNYPKKAQLQPIPAFEEPFSRVLANCVGAQLKTKAGNQYLLTISYPFEKYKVPDHYLGSNKDFSLWSVFLRQFSETKGPITCRKYFEK